MPTNDSFKERRERNLASRDETRAERQKAYEGRTGLSEARQARIARDNERRRRIMEARTEQDAELEADRQRRREEFEERNYAAAKEQERDPMDRYQPEGKSQDLPDGEGEMETKELGAPATKEKQPRRKTRGGVNIRDERIKPGSEPEPSQPQPPATGGEE